MVKTCRGCRTRNSALIVDDSDTVMFFVVTEECNKLVFEYPFRPQECGPEFYQGADVGRSEDDMS
jgi:hypothetical protein